MTATATPPPPRTPAPPRHTGRASLARVVQSEWTKLRSVRSTFWTVVAMFAVTVGLSTLICWGIAATWDQVSPSERATFDATSISLAGMTFGQLAIVVLGVMVISTEYSTGGIRTTLSAVPRRERVLAAKAIVLVALSLVAGLVTSFASFFVGQAFLSIADIQTSLGEPQVLRAVIGGGLYLAASALFGFALGALLRNTAGSITLAVAGLLVLPGLVSLLPGSWGDAVERFFTSNAGQQIMVVDQTSTNALGPWAGYAVFCAWSVVILLVATVLMARRDA